MGEPLSLSVPRGTVGLPSLELDMRQVYEAEKRLADVRCVTPVSANELASLFNGACGVTSKYVGWIEYEILKAKKGYGLARATVILEKLPEEAKKLKDSGLKPNDDWREALIARDTDCQKAQEIMDSLEAVKAFLNSKLKTFERAYYTCYREKDRKGALPSPALTGHIGETYDQPQADFMGKAGGGKLDDETLALLDTLKT